VARKHQPHPGISRSPRPKAKSPAAAAGLQAGDLITAINRRPSSTLTLGALFELLERAAASRLTILRGDRTLEFIITPKSL
jgi:C-terminal processing protease CtpA/Prc